MYKRHFNTLGWDKLHYKYTYSSFTVVYVTLNDKYTLNPLRLVFSYVVNEGCTNHGRQVAMATKFCTVATNICGLSVWNWLHVSVLTSTRAVRKVSGHFELLDNRSRGLDVIWQPVRGDLTVHP
jgi:hypothetical protein